MNYCDQLHFHMNFLPTCISPCCDVHRAGAPEFPFTGGYVDFEKYTKHIEEVREKIQNPPNAFCTDCSDIYIYSGQEFPPMDIRIVSINPHKYYCDCRCVYCHLWNYPEKIKPYSMYEPLTSLYEQKAINPETTSLHWGGGESTLLKDFEETSRWSLDNGFVQYVHTNGFHLSQSIISFLQEDKGSVNISLDCGDRETYKRVKGVDKWDAVTKHIADYANNAKDTNKVNIKYIIFKENNSLKQIEKFFEFCKKSNVSLVEFSFDFRDIRDKSVTDQSVKAAALFRHLAKVNGMAVEPFFMPMELQEKVNAQLEKMETSPWMNVKRFFRKII